MIFVKAHVFCLLLTISLAHSATVKDLRKDAVPVLRKVRDSKYYEQNYKEDRSLKPEDNSEDDRDLKTGKRCTACDSGYLRPSNERYYERDPYSSKSRTRYDPYNDDYDYYNSRGRTRYSSDRYEPRDRYYDRDSYYNPYRGYDAYSPYDDYYSRGYESSSSRGSYGSRPEYGGGNGYARGYNYGGERDRYGGYGSGYGSYSSGSRSRYPSYDYDSGYRSTSYLYGRPSSTTTDNPKSSGPDQSNTASPLQGNNPSGRN